MKSYKQKFQDFEMTTDHKASGEWKKKIQRQVRRELKRSAEKEIKDELRSQQEDKKGKRLGR